MSVHISTLSVLCLSLIYSLTSAQTVWVPATIARSPEKLVKRIDYMNFRLGLGKRSYTTENNVELMPKFVNELWQSLYPNSHGEKLRKFLLANTRRPTIKQLVWTATIQ